MYCKGDGKVTFTRNLMMLGKCTYEGFVKTLGSAVADVP